MFAPPPPLTLPLPNPSPPLLEQGKISDKPGVQYYSPKKQLSTGFWRHRCHRSEGGLEGMHYHKRAAQSRSRACGPRMLHVRSCLFDLRWNCRAAWAAGLMYNYGHCRLYLVDILYDVVGALAMTALPPHRGEGLKLAELEFWRRTREGGVAPRRGIMPAALVPPPLPAPLPPRARAAEWLVAMSGAKPLSPIKSKVDQATVLQETAALHTGDAAAMLEATGMEVRLARVRERRAHP